MHRPFLWEEPTQDTNQTARPQPARIHISMKEMPFLFSWGNMPQTGTASPQEEILMGRECPALQITQTGRRAVGSRRLLSRDLPPIRLARTFAFNVHPAVFPSPRIPGPRKRQWQCRKARNSRQNTQGVEHSEPFFQVQEGREKEAGLSFILLTFFIFFFQWHSNSLSSPLLHNSSSSAVYRPEYRPFPSTAMRQNRPECQQTREKEKHFSFHTCRE